MNIASEALSKFKAAMDSVTLTDAQNQALEEFLGVYEESVKREAFEKASARIAELEQEIETLKSSGKFDDQKYVTFEEAEAAFELARKDFMAQGEKAFELYQEDMIQSGEKILQAAREDMAKEFGDKLAESIAEIRPEIEAKVRAEYIESLERVREAITPVVGKPDEKKAVAEQQKLKKQLEMISEEKAQLNRKQLITTLTLDLPEERREKAVALLEQFESEDEIMQGYRRMIDLMGGGKPTSIKNKPQPRQSAVRERYQEHVENKRASRRQPVKPYFESVERTGEVRKADRDPFVDGALAAAFPGK